MLYPPALSEIVRFFESLPEAERRENLIDLAVTAEKYGPRASERFEIDDVRKDPECMDTVGVHLSRNGDGGLHLAISLGPKVQTLTRAMAAILCRGLEGASIEELVRLPQDFVPRIVGAELVRLRSQTVYYILRRIKEAMMKLEQSEDLPSLP